LTDTVSEDFIKLRNCDFGYRTNKKISDLVGQPIKQFKEGKSLEDMLQDGRVRDAIFENNKLNFLLSPDKFENFKILLEELSSRKAGTVSKSDNNSNAPFISVHGAKGKQFGDIGLGSDILKCSVDGDISEEEYYVAYVALTRTLNSVFFVQASEDNSPHNFYEFAISHRDELEEALREDYTYTFPLGVSMKISQVGNTDKPLFQHTFFNSKSGDMSLFLLDEPIKMGTCGYRNGESANFIRFWNKDKKETILTFDGDNASIQKEDLSSFDFYYGVGKIADKKKAEKPQQMRASLQPSR
jgi:hypothetical protein